jgi:hypothetical protein
VPHDNIPDLFQFLEEYPGMSLKPSRYSGTVLSGSFWFTASRNGKEISDSYPLTINIPKTFPHSAPSVFDVGNKIPRTKEGSYHINYDDSLCLGSPLRILLILNKNPTLIGFIENCLIPYLYAISNKVRNGGALVFDELDHGRPGLIQDYSSLFKVGPHEVEQTLRILSVRKRVANKFKCPCGCSHRLGLCKFRHSLLPFRKSIKRRTFKSEFKQVRLKKTKAQIPQECQVQI